VSARLEVMSSDIWIWQEGGKEESEQGNMASLTGEQHKKAREEEELDSCHFLGWG